jgi:hypothetical protein
MPLNGTSSLYLFPALLQTPGKRKALGCTALGALPSTVTGKSTFLLLYFSVPNPLRVFYYTYYA